MERMREATTRIVIEGNVLEALALENVPIMGGDVYPAVVEVLCVYKGPRVDERITIAGFGI